MQLYEMLNCTSLVPGIPVSKEGSDHWYIEVGVWRESEDEDEENGLFVYTDDDDESRTFHGKIVKVEKGVDIVIGSDDQARVFSGKLVYRNNEYWLAPCEKDDEQAALVLFRYDAQPRARISSGKPQIGDVSRWLSADDVAVHYTDGDDQPSLYSLFTVKVGSKLWVSETRRLRVAGTGASLSRPLNIARYASITRRAHEVEITGVSFEELATAVSHSHTKQEEVSVEAWGHQSSGVPVIAVFQTAPSQEPGVIKTRAASSLGLHPDDSCKFEEVAAA